MIRLFAAALALPILAAPDRPDDATETLAFAQITVREQIIIRVPRGTQRVPAMSHDTQWRETGSPRCIPAGSIAAAMPGNDGVDLVLTDNRRVRADLGQGCSGLDYYRGLYVDARPDGQICARRDVMRSRMGGHCEITRLRVLEPVRR